MARGFTRRRYPLSSILHPLKILSLTILLLAGAGAARAQEAPPADTAETRRVQILHADSLAGSVQGQAGTQRLFGNVRLRQGQTLLWADRAVRYLARDEALLTGNVLIVEEGDSLTADSVRYDSRRKIGYASGRVRLSDGEVVVLGPSGRYFTQEERAVFTEGVTLIDSTNILTSRRGEYFTEEERAEFAGEVLMRGEGMWLEADSVTYLREEDISIARGHVFIERLDEENTTAADSLAAPPLRLAARPDSLLRPDVLRPRLDTAWASVAAPDSVARTLLFGRRAYNDEDRRYSRVTGEALLVRLEPDSAEGGAGADSLAGGVVTDTLVLAARQLQTLRTDSLERLIATGDVRIWQADLAAVADSAVYEQWTVPDATAPNRPASDSIAVDSTMLARSAPDSTRQASAAPGSVAPDTVEVEETRLYRQPMAWTEQAQLSGDTLRITGRNQAVDSLFAYANAFVAQRDTALDRIHQLRGRDLLGLFENDSLRYLRVRPNAESIRYLQGEDGGRDGAIQASADQVEFWLRGGELHRVKFGRGVEGKQYREEALSSPLRLQGFVWRPEARPRREALLDRPEVQARLDEAPPQRDTVAARRNADPPEER